MKHYSNEEEEYLKKEDRVLHGRTEKQYEDSAKILIWAATIAGAVIALGVIQHLIFVIF
jgi:hypothetical protein